MHMERRKDHWLVGIVEGCSRNLSIGSIVRDTQGAIRALDEQTPVLKIANGHRDVRTVTEIGGITVWKSKLIMCDCNTGPMAVRALRQHEAIDGTSQVREPPRQIRDAIARLTTEMTQNEVISFPGAPKNASSTIAQRSGETIMQKLDKSSLGRARPAMTLRRA